MEALTPSLGRVYVESLQGTFRALHRLNPSIASDMFRMIRTPNSPELSSIQAALRI